MNKLEGCFSSKKDDWETPDDLYRQLDNEFHFDLDPCADYNNHKCNLYYTKDENGLLQDWQGHTVFCTPLYGAKSTADWIKSVPKKVVSQTLWWLCLFLHALIRKHSTNTYMEKQKSDLSKAG